VTTTVYAPGSQERDPSKQNMALQDHASKISSNTDDIATNTADIAALEATGLPDNLNLGGSTLYGILTYQYGTSGAPATSGTTDANVASRFGVQGVGVDFGVYSSGNAWIQSRLKSNLATNFALALSPNGGGVAIGKSTAATALDVSGTVTATAFSGPGLGPPDVIIEDQKTAGTTAGGFTSGSQRRDLNTLVRNINTLVSLSSNQFTILTAGTFFLRWSAPAWRVDQHMAFLKNDSDSINYAGGGEYSPSAVDSAQSRSFGETILTIAGARTFSLFHTGTTTRAANGFGLATGNGLTEVYSRVEIWKLV